MLSCCMLSTSWAAEPLKALRIAANPNLSSIELLTNFGPLAAAMEKELSLKVELVTGKDYADTLNQLKTGAVDIAGTGAFGYVTAMSEFSPKLLVRFVEDDGESYRAVIITRTDSTIRSVADLRGKRFAFTDLRSTSGFLLPMLEMQRNGIELKDLGKAEFVKKQPNSAVAVYTRQVDAGAIADNQLGEKYGVKLDELRVIWRSEPIFHGVWLARPSMSDDDVKRITQALLKISASPEAKQMFRNASVRGFTAAKDSDFDNVRTAKRLLDKLEKEK
nr:phosphate/phosphite/phosphonate ABC transporter substrate-binding protein [Chitinivorax sp. B]